MSFRLLMVSLYPYSVYMFSWQDDFLLIHYDKGPCRNKLGHSRASVIWHRTQVRNPSSAALPHSLTLTQVPLPPVTTLQHVAIHMFSGSASFSLSASHTHTSDGLLLSWQHNKKRTAWSTCGNKCLVFTVVLFPTKPIMYTFHYKKKVYITKVLLYL